MNRHFSEIYRKRLNIISHQRNENEKHNECRYIPTTTATTKLLQCYLTLCDPIEVPGWGAIAFSDVPTRMAKMVKTDDDTKCHQEVEQLGTSYPAGGNVRCYNCFGKLLQSVKCTYRLT